MYDIIIIGAGIVGTMLAKDLSQYKCKVAVIEKENDIANGATMAKYKQVGAFVVACDKEEEERLHVLEKRAIERNIPYEWLSGDEARKKEKNLSLNITKALNFYTTAIIYPWQVACACMEVAMDNGVELYLNHEVTAIEKREDSYQITTSNKGTFETKHIINASGISADKIHRMVDADCAYTMRPRKGEYYVLDNDIHYVDHIIFPVPSSKGKGVLAVPTVYGNTLLGPDAEESEDTGTSSKGLSYVKENIQKTMMNVPFHKVIRTFAGLRPSSTSKDFIIEEVKGCPGFIDVASIESPGLASAPAISKYVIEQFLNDMTLEKNNAAVKTRKKPIAMADLSAEERDAMIRENPLYAKIICRCESISEGEIIDCIHRNCGARSVKGVKKRVRPGMGRCQGGFCEPRVVSILARELGISVLDVVLDSEDSKILTKENRI